MNPATALATALADEIARGGVTDACLAPGSRSAPLALALARHGGIRLHVRIDERSAAFCAVGLARGSGRPAVVACTSGTAAGNLHPAVVEAEAARVPLLVLTADRPPELRDTGANQTADQIRLYGGAVRWFCEVGVSEARQGANAYWRSVAARAVAEAAGATGGPAGPVHLNLAFREPLVEVAGTDAAAWPGSLAGRAGGAPWSATTRPPRPPLPADVEWLAAQVARCERGLLVAGDPPPGLDPQPLLALAAAAGWPVVAEPTSGARRGPQVVSTASLLLHDRGFAAAHTPDLVVSIGRPVLSRGVLALLRATPLHVVCDPDGRWLDPERTAARLLVAEPGLLAEAVTAAAPRREGSAWLDAWLGAEERALEAVAEVLDDDLVTEQRTARDLAALMPDGGLLVAGSSLPIRHLNAVMRPRSGLRVLGNRGVSGIDGFVSTVLGAALGAARPAVALAGDLAVIHDAPGMFLGPAEPRPDVTLVVLDNAGGGIFSLLPQAGLDAGEFERLFGTPHTADLAALATAAGWGHARVERPGDLADRLAVAAGLTLLEVRTDRAETAALQRRLEEAVAEAQGRR